MSLITIDPKACKQCKSCVAICPMKIIIMRETDPTPRLIRSGERFCIRCGHCVGICPHDALDHAEIPMSQCPPVRKEFIPPPEQIEHILRYRRSIRFYKEKEVDRALLEDIVRIARYAPTATNSQQIRWAVVPTRAEVVRISSMAIDWCRNPENAHIEHESYKIADVARAFDHRGIDLFCRNAPALIVAHAPKKYGFAVADSASAMTYFDLASPSFGLGTCWAGLFLIAAMHHPPLQRALQIPQENAPCAAMLVGYPKYKYHRLPQRIPPKIYFTDKMEDAE